MKPINRISLLAFFLSITALGLQAQPGPPPGDENGQREAAREANFERIKAARQEFLIERLSLTEEEQRNFFPVFWRFETEKKALRKRMSDGVENRRRRNREVSANPTANLTEDEARTLIENRMKLETELLALRKRQFNAFLQILPPTKVINLEHAEREFRRELVANIRSRHRGERMERGAGRRF